LNKFIKIYDRLVGDNKPVFIIAEMSANHLQKFDNAVKLIKAAKEAGADAIWDGQSLYELYKKAYTPWEWQPKLKEIAESEGLICFSTPSDKSSVDFLEKINVPAYKIASFEITDIPLIEYVASKGKPVIISTNGE